MCRSFGHYIVRQDINYRTSQRPIWNFKDHSETVESGWCLQLHWGGWQCSRNTAAQRHWKGSDCGRVLDYSPGPNTSRGLIKFAESCGNNYSNLMNWKRIKCNCFNMYVSSLTLVFFPFHHLGCLENPRDFSLGPWLWYNTYSTRFMRYICLVHTYYILHCSARQDSNEHLSLSLLADSFGRGSRQREFLRVFLQLFTYLLHITSWC